MYAIVDIAGQQFKVTKNQKLFVHRLEDNKGTDISFNKVLLIEDDGKITVGEPLIKNAAVSAKVLDHVKGDKVLVFKKKRRKGYQKLNGHRQYLTQIEITDIGEKAVKKAASKAEDTKQEVSEKKSEAPKAESSTEVKETKANVTPPQPKKETTEKAGSTEEKKVTKKAAPAAKEDAAATKDTKKDDSTSVSKDTDGDNKE